MEYKRKPMSVYEKHLLEANKELVDKLRFQEKDILKLISYIKGNKCLWSEVETIINSYINKKVQPSKYDKREL